MKKEKIIVTGGAGFIGSNLVQKLVEEGYDVHVIDNLSGGKREKVHKDATLHVADIRKIDQIMPVFKDAVYVFHLAALPRVQYSIEFPLETHEANVTGTLNVLFAAKEAKVKKLIYSASSSAYGDQPIMPLVESMSAHPKSPYGLQKYIGELQCRVFTEVYGLPTVCLRYFNVYGPGQSDEGAYALVIAKFLKQRREGKPMTITGDGSQSRDFTHVFDVVRANMLAMQNENVGKGEVLNIGAGNNVSIKEIAQMIGGPIEYVEARLEPKHTRADNSKAREIIGWIPDILIQDGILGLKKLYL